MKLYHTIVAIALSLQLSVNCHKITSLEKRSESSTFIGPSGEDKEILREAFRLMNAGKKTLGLMTESPEQMLQLVESSTEKAEQIQRLLQHIPDMSSGEQYLALSGKNGHFKVDNFTNITGSPKTASNDTVAEDIFKLVMEKKHPGRTDTVFRRITIIESNQLKPFGDFPPMTPRKQQQVRFLRRVFSLPPRTRKKRTKEKYAPRRELEPFFVSLNPVYRRFTSPKSNMDAVLSVSSKRKLSEVNPETIGVASQEISIDKSMLTYLLNLKGEKEEKRTFVEALTVAFLLSLCTLLGILIYRWWTAKKSVSSRSLELKGENIIVKLGDHNRGSEKAFVYQPIPQADLEWQSEDGDWLSYKDFHLM